MKSSTHNTLSEDLVSVIIPTYNRAAFIEEAIESVLGQTYSHIELIVVDDGSTDTTSKIIEKYSEKIVCIHQENQGVSSARNRGIASAKGAFIAFLDSDDRFVPKKIETQVAAMRENPSYLVSHTQEKWYRRGVFLNQKKKHRKESGYLFKRCLELCAVGMSTIMVRNDLFAEIGLFDESLPCCEDYDLWIRVSVSMPFLLVDEPLTIKNGGRPDQLSVQYRIGMDAYRVKSILKLLDSTSLNSDQLSLAHQELVEKAGILANGYHKHGKSAEADYYFKLVQRYSA